MVALKVGAKGSCALLLSNVTDDSMSTQFTSWIEQSKESLSIAGPICNEANELLSTARGQMEKSSVLWAQTVYLHTVINGQFEVLQAISDSAVQKEKRHIAEFDVCIFESQVS